VDGEAQGLAAIVQAAVVGVVAVGFALKQVWPVKRSNGATLEDLRNELRAHRSILESIDRGIARLLGRGEG